MEKLWENPVTGSQKIRLFGTVTVIEEPVSGVNDAVEEYFEMSRAELAPLADF